MSSGLPDVSIRQLEYLVAVADSPSWGHAATQVGVSPSALSQGLSELERRIGLALFDREGRRRVLRQGANPLLGHARQVLALTSDLARWAERTRSGDAGDLRLGMIDAAAVHHYPHVLRGFRDAHPDLALRLRVGPSGSLLEQLVAGELDIVVCVEPVNPVQGIVTEPILIEQLAVYRPGPGRLLAPAGWGPWVLFPEGAHTREIVEEALRSVGAPIEVVAESHQPEVLREMVQLGLGWTVLPVAQAEDGARPLGGGRILTQRQLVTAVRSGFTVAPAVSALRGALAAA